MLVIKDFATTILASALTAAATSVVVSDASRLPALSAGDYYYLVLQKFTDRTSVEVVKVTGATGNTLTVVRAQAGTTAKSFAIGDYAEQRVTVGTFSEYIAQSVAGKVDKSGAVVEQSLSFLSTGDLVSAGVGIAYEANRHVTALGGGVGANTVNPFVALRPLGKDNSSVQAIYDFNGNFALLGGERKAEVGKLVSLTPADSFGWPNAIANNANNYSTRYRQKFSAGNNALYILADGAANARRFGIQSGHESTAYANLYGVLDLNPFGGTVRVNGGVVYHTNYAPTPAAVGALALVGGVLTGPLAISPAVGVNPLDLLSTPDPTGTSAQGVAGWDSTGATREWGVGRYAANGVAEYAYFGFGVAPWNSGLRVYGAGDLRAGAVNRLYHEGYLPTPDTLGAVPQARTINSKPLTSNITLSAADVGAAPAGFGLGGYGTGIGSVLGDTPLRRQSGFFQGSYIEGLPTSPHSWNYVFNQAHGNAAGFFGYLAINFNCSKAWIGGQDGGAQKGPFELVKQGDRFVASGAYGNDYYQCAIEVNGSTAIDSRPGIGFHMGGRFAGTLHLWEGGDFRFHTEGLASYAGIMTGNVNANDVYIRSDRRLKKNLVEVRDALRKVSSLTAYSYDKKQTLEAAEYDKKEVGLIAQDVEQVLPEAVTRVVDSSNKDGTEILTLSNSALIALLVGAVKELSEKVKELEYGRP